MLGAKSLIFAVASSTNNTFYKNRPVDIMSHIVKRLRALAPRSLTATLYLNSAKSLIFAVASSINNAFYKNRPADIMSHIAKRLISIFAVAKAGLHQGKPSPRQAVVSSINNTFYKNRPADIMSHFAKRFLSKNRRHQSSQFSSSPRQASAKAGRRHGRLSSHL